MATKFSISNENNNKSLFININVRTLNQEEYAEMFTAVRALEKITDKYIYGATVIRPDERENEEIGKD